MGDDLGTKLVLKKITKFIKLCRDHIYMSKILMLPSQQITITSMSEKKIFIKIYIQLETPSIAHPQVVLAHQLLIEVGLPLQRGYVITDILQSHYYHSPIHCSYTWGDKYLMKMQKKNSAGRPFGTSLDVPKKRPELEVSPLGRCAPYRVRH